MISRRDFLKFCGLGIGAVFTNINITRQIFKDWSEVITVHDTQEFIETLSDTTIAPGTTIEMDDGVYSGYFEYMLKGTAEAPIVIRPINPGSVIIDGSFTDHNSDLSLNASYVNIYDIDFVNSNTDRTDNKYGIVIWNPGICLYGCGIRDLHNNGVSWYGSGVGAVKECVIYNNGYRVGGVGFAHAIYTHNNAGGDRIIANNILGNQLGEYTIHVYSDGANWTKDYNIHDNVICGDDCIVGGGLGLVDMQYYKNVQFENSYYVGRYSAGNVNGYVHDNYFIGLEYIFVDTDPAWDLTEENNEVYGHTTLDRYGDLFVRSGYTEYDLPESKFWVTKYSHSARWLGMVAIYNRDSADTIGVSLESILGRDHGRYRLRNGQNMDETWEFTYSGLGVDVPMNIWHPSHVIGEGVGENHLPVFGAFVVEKIPKSKGNSRKTYFPTIRKNARFMDSNTGNPYKK